MGTPDPLSHLTFRSDAHLSILPRRSIRAIVQRGELGIFGLRNAIPMRIARPTHSLRHASAGVRAASPERCAACASNEALRVLSPNGQATATVVRCDGVVNDAIRRHGLSASSAMALGRALVGTLLLSAFQKSDEQVNCIFSSSDGEAGKLNVIGKSDGYVRGYMQNPVAEPPRLADGSIDVPGTVGRDGSITVVRSHPSFSEPYTGILPLHNGEVGQDILKYLHDSEQVNAALGLGISFDKDGCKSAGGYLVQQLPVAEESTTQAIESNISHIQQHSGGTTQMLDKGLTADKIAMKLFAGDQLGGWPGDIENQLEDAARLQPEYGPCELDGEHGLKARMRRAVASLGREEVESILQEMGCVEVACNFCNSEFNLFLARMDAFLQCKVLQICCVRCSCAQQLYSFIAQISTETRHRHTGMRLWGHVARAPAIRSCKVQKPWSMAII